MEPATAQAELQILLFATNQVRTKLKSRISVPASQSRRLIDLAGQMTQAALVVGTLAGSHLGPVLTAVIVAVELLTPRGIARIRRIARRR